MIILSYAAYGITTYGHTNLFLQISKREDARVDYLFEGFRGFKRMMKTMWAMLAILLYTGIWVPMLGTIVFGLLGFLDENANPSFIIVFFILLAISFIVMAILYFSYSMTYYVMVEKPEYSVSQAMKESKNLMKGHKLDLFLFMAKLYRVGYFSDFTLGIGFLWLSPYVSTTTAHFTAIFQKMNCSRNMLY